MRTTNQILMMSTGPALNQDLELKEISAAVVTEFFEDYSLEDNRYYLWQLFKLAFSGKVGELKPYQRDKSHVL